MNWGTEINEKEARRKCEQWHSPPSSWHPLYNGTRSLTLLSPGVLPWCLYILDCWSRGNLSSLKLPPVRNLVTTVRETVLSLGHTQLRWHHIKPGLLPVSSCFRAMLNLCGREGVWLFLPWLGQRTFSAIAELCLGCSPCRGDSLSPVTTVTLLSMLSAVVLPSGLRVAISLVIRWQPYYLVTTVRMIQAPWFGNLASKYVYEEGQWYAWVYLDIWWYNCQYKNSAPTLMGNER